MYWFLRLLQQIITNLGLPNRQGIPSESWRSEVQDQFHWVSAKVSGGLIPSRGSREGFLAFSTF